MPPQASDCNVSLLFPSTVSTLILLLFYAMFLMLAVSLNRNARLQQENHLLSLQQERYFLCQNNAPDMISYPGSIYRQV